MVKKSDCVPDRMLLTFIPCRFNLRIQPMRPGCAHK